MHGGIGPPAARLFEQLQSAISLKHIGLRRPCALRQLAPQAAYLTTHLGGAQFRANRPLALDAIFGSLGRPCPLSLVFKATPVESMHGYGSDFGRIVRQLKLKSSPVRGRCFRLAMAGVMRGGALK